MKDLAIAPMKVMVSIVERGQGRNMMDLYHQQAVKAQKNFSGLPYSRKRKSLPSLHQIQREKTLWKLSIKTMV